MHAILTSQEMKLRKVGPSDKCYESLRFDAACALQARKLPETQAEIVEFFLETESDEMEFEVARCRPLLTEDLFAYVQQQISASRSHTSRDRQSYCPSKQRICSQTK